MSDTQWTHKNFTIDLAGAKFCTNVGMELKRFSSLSAATKAIDKWVAEEAVKRGLSSPCPVLVVEASYDGLIDIQKAVITGIEVDPVVRYTKDGGYLTADYNILPDFLSNEELVRELYRVQKVLDDLKQKVAERSLPRARYLANRWDKRKTIDYAVVLDEFERQWQRAVEASQPKAEKEAE